MRHKGMGGGWSRAPTLGVALLLLTAGLEHVDAQTAAPLGGSFDQRFINQGRVAPVFTRPDVRSRLPPLPLPEESTPPSTQATVGEGSEEPEAAEPKGPATALKKLLVPPAEASPAPAPPLNSPPPAPESTPRVAIPAQSHPPVVTGSVQSRSPAPPPVLHGRATWYQHPGRTASGERFDPNRFTAAHRTLPFGTRLRVVNLRTRRSVVVRINDRVPPRRKVVIDLSRASARAIGITGDGSVALYRVHAASGAAAQRSGRHLLGRLEAHQPIRPKWMLARAAVTHARVMRRNHVDVVETTGSIPARPRLRPPSRFARAPAARFVLPEALRPTGL